MLHVHGEYDYRYRTPLYSQASLTPTGVYISYPGPTRKPCCWLVGCHGCDASVGRCDLMRFRLALRRVPQRWMRKLDVEEPGAKSYGWCAIAFAAAGVCHRRSQS